MCRKFRRSNDVSLVTIFRNIFPAIFLLTNGDLIEKINFSIINRLDVTLKPY